MNVLKKALARVRRITAKQAIVASVFALAVVGAGFAGNALKPHASAAPDCGTNSIIPCGYSDPTNLVNELNSNAQWRDVEAQAGHLAPSDYSRFINSAVPGEAMKDGTVVVNGQVVATNAWSLGRHANSHYPQVQYTIDGVTFYASSDQSVFLSGSIPVYVLFNAQGQMQAAIMEPCGNPITTFTPVTPSFTCDMLNAVAEADKLNTYDFTSHVSFASGATFNHVSYDFGDGSPAVSTLGTADVIKHTYAPGTWTATVTAYFNVPGGMVVAAPANPNCSRTITIAAPFFSCNYLQAAIPNQNDKLTFAFTLKGSAGNGATLASADFDFGDGTKQPGIKPGTGNNALVVTTTHTYAKAGSYTVTPILHFTTPSGSETVTGTGPCVAHVSPTLPPQPCQPGGTPAPGSPQCQQPCSSPTSIPAAGSPQCTPPQPTPPPATTLPDTGAGNVIGLFAGTSVLGTAAHFLVQKRRLARSTNL